MDCVAAPLDQSHEVAEGAVSVTLPPAQKVVGPPGVIEGVGGRGSTVTVAGADTALVQPFASEVCTVKVPELLTVMVCVVAPFDHSQESAGLAVSVTLPPAQKVVGPPAVMVGVAAGGLTVTVIGLEAAEVQPSTLRACTL